MMKDEVLTEAIETAREVLAGELESVGRIGTLAHALVQLSERCVIGLPCAKHGGAVHGREAEELRAGIEKMIGEYDRLTRGALQRLLDDVDARDSLGYLEATDAKEATS